MTGNRNLLKLTAEQKQELQRWAQSRTLPAGDVFRARLLLALAQGITYREIARSMKTSTPTVARWKMRFEQAGDGRSGRPSPRQQAACGHAGGAGTSDPASPAEAGRRQHPLVLPE